MAASLRGSDMFISTSGNGRRQCTPRFGEEGMAICHTTTTPHVSSFMPWVRSTEHWNKQYTLRKFSYLFSQLELQEYNNSTLKNVPKALL